MLCPKTLPSPIVYDETFDVLDATKLKCYMHCPRRYFYEYVLAWRPDLPSNHLVFGSAVHKAMEHLLRNGYGDVKGAFEVFLAEYREHFPPETDLEKAPKNPSNFLAALTSYVDLYRYDAFEVLHTETAGTVFIDDDLALHYKMDAVIRDASGIWGLEHKTASRRDNAWVRCWSTDMQIAVYTHVLYNLYELPSVRGVKVNGLFLKKGGNEFTRVPVSKPLDIMNQWLWTVNLWVDNLKTDFADLAGCHESDPYMAAFPMNDRACTAYGGCPFIDFCAAWANPLRRAAEPPPGYKVEHWDPRERAKEAREIIHITAEGKDTPHV